MPAHISRIEKKTYAKSLIEFKCFRDFSLLDASTSEPAAETVQLFLSGSVAITDSEIVTTGYFLGVNEILKVTEP